MRFRRPYIVSAFASLLLTSAACVSAVGSTFHAGGQSSVPGRPPVPGAPAGVTAFVAVAVVPMDQERMLPNHTVLVEGGRITALGPSDKVKVPAGTVRIDGRGKYLIPGLADMHAHVNFSEDPLYANLQSDSAVVQRRLFRTWLAQGVTTIRNLDYSSPDIGVRSLQLRARAAAGTLLSPRIYTAGPWTGRDGVLAFRKMKPEQVAQAVAAYKAAGYDFIKVHDEAGQILIDSLVAAARREGVPIIGHPPRDEKGKKRIDWTLAAPFRSVEHLDGYSLDDPSRFGELATATQRAGVWVCPTLVIIDEAAKIPSANYNRPAGLRRQLVKALQDAGAGLLLGTDDFFSNNRTITVQDELHALVEAGLTPYQALVTGTRNVAAYFGTLDESGTVAAGKRADLVMLSGNPLQDIRHTARPAGVMLGGRWLPRAEIDRRLADIEAAGVARPSNPVR